MPPDAWTEFSAESIAQLSHPIDPKVNRLLIQLSNTFAEPDFHEFVDSFADHEDDIGTMAEDGNISEKEAACLRQLVEDARTRLARQRFDEKLAESKAEFEQLQSQLLFLDLPIEQIEMLSSRLSMVIDNVEQVVNDTIVFGPGCEQMWIAGPRGSLDYLKCSVRDQSLDCFPKSTPGSSFGTREQTFLDRTKDSIFEICDQGSRFYAYKHRSKIAEDEARIIPNI